MDNIYILDMKAMKIVITKENEIGSISCNLVKHVKGNYDFSINNENSASTIEPGWYCAAKRALQGAVIAVSDGPSPIMDVAAIAYKFAYSKDC